ncbi:MAG: hypothetical protein ACTS3F_15025 [Phycisphaerales bacterium]
MPPSADNPRSPSDPQGDRAAVPPTPNQGVHILDLGIHSQPNDETCGPTCLHAVYRYWGDDIELDEVVRTVRSLNDAGVGRGTLAVNLGEHALRRGYRASITTFNVNLFDPTWFRGGKRAGDPELLSEKLRQQAAFKGAGNPKFRAATEAYLEFIALGGEVRFEDATSRLIVGHLRHGRPILTGVSSTFLYQSCREFGPNDDDDDIRGEPAGHFVILHGYDPVRRVCYIADPLENNPGFARRNYTVPMARLIASIMLGIITYDANMLVLEPLGREHADPENSTAVRPPTDRSAPSREDEA